MHAPSLIRQQRGFSLVEIMVGLVIGMATVVIMLQMLSNSDKTKRNAAGGNDAQMSGTLALYTLERDIRESGYGINDPNLLGCTLTYQTSGDTATVTIPLAPTTINPSTNTGPTVPAGDANTDTLLVMYGNGEGSTEGDPLIANSTTGTYQVTTGSTFFTNNILIAQAAARPTPCALTTDKVINVNGAMLSVDPGVAGLPVGSIIYNLGSAPIVHAYAVRKGNLTMCDFAVWDCSNSKYATAPDSNVWVPVAGNIVALRAQYGHDYVTSNPFSKVVSDYDQITPMSAADKKNYTPPQCSWARTLSVRLGLVARSGAYDKNSPTQKAPVWAGSTVNPSSPTNLTAVPFDLSGNPSWHEFRYKSMETTVPLRNAIWQGGAGC